MNIVRGVLKETISNPIAGTNEISIVASKNVIENPLDELKAKKI